MSRRVIAAIAVALFTIAGPIAAQSPATGTWSIQLPDAVRNEDGVQTVVSTTTAVLILTARGDSLVGTLTRANSTTPRAVRGAANGAQITLLADTKARAMMNGEEQTFALITTFRLTLDGNTLRGTSETSFDPASKPATPFPGVEQAPVPVTATRQKP
jgi:hypothetical protein